MIDQDISRCLASIKEFWSFQMLIQELERQSSHLALGWSQARWIAFGSSRLGDCALQEDIGT